MHLINLLRRSRAAQNVDEEADPPQKTSLGSDETAVGRIYVTHQPGIPSRKPLRDMIHTWPIRPHGFRFDRLREKLGALLSKDRLTSPPQSEYESSLPSNVDSPKTSIIGVTPSGAARALQDVTILQVLHIAFDIRNDNHRSMHWRLANLFARQSPKGMVTRAITAGQAIDWLEKTENASAVIVSGSGFGGERESWSIVAFALRQFAQAGGIIFFKDVAMNTLQSEFLQNIFGLDWQVTGQAGQYVPKRRRIRGHRNYVISVQRNLQNLALRAVEDDEVPANSFTEDGAFSLNAGFVSAASRQYGVEVTGMPMSLEEIRARREYETRISRSIRRSHFRAHQHRSFPTTLVNVYSGQQLYRADVREDSGFVMDREIPTLVAMTQYRQRGWICFLGFGPGTDRELRAEARIIQQLMKVFDADRREVNERCNPVLKRSYSRFRKQLRILERGRLFGSLANTWDGLGQLYDR